MKRLITIIILATTISSCVTQKRCNEKFPPNEKTETVIEYRDSIIEVKVPVNIPGQVIYLASDLKCDSAGIVRDFKLKEKKGNVTAIVEVKDGKLTVECKTDSLEMEITHMAKVQNVYKSKVTELVHEIEKVRAPWYLEYLVWYFCISLIILLILLLYYAAKLKLKYSPLRFLS